MQSNHSPLSDRCLAHPHPAFPLVYILSMTSYGMEYPLASWGKLPGCVSSQILMDLSNLLAGQHEKLRSPWLSVSIAQQHLSRGCVINIALMLNTVLYKLLGRRLTPSQTKSSFEDLQFV